MTEEDVIYQAYIQAFDYEDEPTAAVVHWLAMSIARENDVPAPLPDTVAAKLRKLKEQK